MNFYSLINKGYNGELISVQCRMRQGFPSFDITGLCDSVIKESKERIRESLRARGFHFPQEAILINLLPQTLEKTGGTLDVAIALSLLFQKTDASLSVFALGELDINGNILPTPGVQNAIELSKKANVDVLVVSSQTEIETKEALRFSVVKVNNIGEAFDALVEVINEKESEKSAPESEEGTDCEQNSTEAPVEFTTAERSTPNAMLPLNEEYVLHPFKGIIGLTAEKEALAVAVAGHHNLMFFGSKGVGKTLLMSRLPYLSPRLDEKSKVELSKTRSSFDLYPADRGECITLDASNRGSIMASGGGKSAEILLAHGGTIVLDEITSMDEKTLISLRTIHDSGYFMSSKKEMFPLRFNMIAALNPCPCGNRGSRRTPCNCADVRINAHLKNIQTPLLSRFDEVCSIEEASFLEDDDKGFDNIVERIERARERQYKRYENEKSIRTNGDLAIYGANEKTLKRAFMFFPNSENPRDALLHYGVALTLADLDDNDEIDPIYVQKAELLKVYDIAHYYER